MAPVVRLSQKSYNLPIWYNAVFLDRGDFGRLGHGNSSDLFTPQPIKALLGLQIRQIACGDSHCLAVTMEGEVQRLVAIATLFPNLWLYLFVCFLLGLLLLWQWTKTNLVNYESFSTFSCFWSNTKLITCYYDTYVLMIGNRRNHPVGYLYLILENNLLV